jgi:23S rRNA (cytosine1962-C5)-methyltransferase
MPKKAHCAGANRAAGGVTMPAPHLRAEEERALEGAWQRRAALHSAPDTDAYRLLNRAGDGFPSLAVDRYADVLVAHVYSQGVPMDPPRRLLAELAQRAGARAVYVKVRPVQASVLDEHARAELAPRMPLLGTPVEQTVARESGLRYIVRPGDGLNVGLFLDMREVRAAVRVLAAGRTVLNCFAYTCAFGVAALAGGARRVLNLDISRRYLDWGRENTALNGFSALLSDFVRGDVFDWLARLGRRGERFDIVILDPPSYSTTRETRFSVERDMPRLVALAARVVAPGGWLIACTNCEQLGLGGFVARVRAGLEGHAAQIVRTQHEPADDFPLAPGAPPHLKVCFIRFGAASAANPRDAPRRRTA